MNGDVAVAHRARPEGVDGAHGVDGHLADLHPVAAVAVGEGIGAGDGLAIRVEHDHVARREVGEPGAQIVGARLGGRGKPGERRRPTGLDVMAEHGAPHPVRVGFEPRPARIHPAGLEDRIERLAHGLRGHRRPIGKGDARRHLNLKALARRPGELAYAQRGRSPLVNSLRGASRGNRPRRSRR